MSSFNKLLTRLSFLTEASPMDRIIPGFQTQARQYAVKEKGVTAGTREGRLAMLSILYDLDIIDDAVVKRFKNDSGVSRMVDYYEETGISTKIKERAEEIQAYMAEHLHNKVSFTTGNRSDEKIQKYEINKLDQELKQAKRAARLERKKETAEAINILAEPISDFENLSSAVVGSYSDDYLLEIIGEKGITLYQITRVVKYLTQFVSEHDVEVSGRSIDVVFAKDSKLGKIVSKLGADKVEVQIRKDIEMFGDFGVVIHEPDMDQQTDMIGNLNNIKTATFEDEENHSFTGSRDNYPEEEEEDDFAKLAQNYEGVQLAPEIQQAQLDVAQAITSEPEASNDSSGTSSYMTEQVKKDSVTHVRHFKSITFKEKYKPQTYKQLEELRRYGL